MTNELIYGAGNTINKHMIKSPVNRMQNTAFPVSVVGDFIKGFILIDSICLHGTLNQRDLPI